MHSSSRGALALGIALALSTAPVLADWKNDYDRGIKAAESGQWQEAQRLFASAAREESEPAERKLFQGVVRKLYVPHYYAGLAAYRQNDCQTALEYWGHGPTNAILAKQADLKGMQSRGITDCNQKLAAASKPPTSTTPTSTTPSTTPSTQVATTTPTKPPDKPVATVPPPKPVETRPVETRPTPPPPSATPAPTALVQAVEAWVAGRYDAVAQLNPASLPDGRSRAQAFLLRAAARHTQAELADGDARLLENARQDVRAARQANASLGPDEILFSPKFRSFWRATR